jgi:hypothetical protein
MGSSVILDIIGSIIVGGLLLLMALRLNTGALENSYAYNSGANLQLSLVTLTTRLEDDFRKIAYCKYQEITPAANAVRKADTSDFCFSGDLDNDGSIDSVEYLLGTWYGCSNKNVKTLIRRGWDETTLTVDSIKLGVTQFKFIYRTCDKDSLLSAPVNLSTNSVGLIDLSVSLESPYRLALDAKDSYETDTSLYKIYWRQFRVIGNNLQYR